MNQLMLTKIVFQREENSPKEEGIIINHDELIIDSSGKIVPAPIWHYNWCWMNFSVTLNLKEQKDG